MSKLAEISALLNDNGGVKVEIKYDNSDLDRVKSEFNNWAVSEKIVYFDFKPRNDPGDFVTATPRPGGSPGGPSGSVRSFVSGPEASVANDVLSGLNEAIASGLTDSATKKIGESIGARLNERLGAARGEEAYITVDALRKLLREAGSPAPSSANRESLVGQARALTPTSYSVLLIGVFGFSCSLVDRGLGISFLKDNRS